MKTEIETSNEADELSAIRESLMDYCELMGVCEFDARSE